MRTNVPPNDDLEQVAREEEFAKLVTLCLEAGIPAYQLAGEFEVTESCIHRWSTGKSVPMPTTLQAITEKLQMLARRKVLENTGDSDVEVTIEEFAAFVAGSIAAGLRTSLISDELKVTEGTIDRWRRQVSAPVVGIRTIVMDRIRGLLNDLQNE